MLLSDTADYPRTFRLLVMSRNVNSLGSVTTDAHNGEKIGGPIVAAD